MLAGSNTEKRSRTNALKGKIYVVTHTATGRVYVGQTTKVRPIERWQDHVSFANRGGDTYFCRALRKYGKDAFTFDVVEHCNGDVINEREAYYIKLLQSNKKSFGFNSSTGGDNANNSRSEEVRRKISRTKKGISSGPCSEKKKRAISDAKMASGYRHSAETINKIKISRAKYPRLTESHRIAISNGLRIARKWKLTSSQASDIKRLVEMRSDKSLSEEFGVSRRTVSHIRRGTYEGPMD